MAIVLPTDTVNVVGTRLITWASMANGDGSTLLTVTLALKKPM